MSTLEFAAACWGWIWAAPLHLLALLLLPFYGPSAVLARGGKLEIRVARAVGNPGGQTLGQVTFYLREPYPALRAHEDRHTVQAQVLGPLMLVLYPLGCVWGALAGHWHDDNPLELDAYRASGVR